MDIKKYNYVIDIFKGTCELNNYNESALIYKQGDLSNFKVFESENNKIYYSGLVYKEKTDCLFGAENKLDPNVYTICEIINLGAKFLNNLDIDDYEIQITTFGSNAEEVIENLETLDLNVLGVEAEPSTSDVLSFSIVVQNEAVICGGMDKNKAYFKARFNDIDKIFNYHEKKVKTDVYVYPLDKESFSDAFILGSNLKDAGFKTEIDYSLKQLNREEIDAVYMISFDKDNIKKYEVKLIDLATSEVKTVGIDNLIEELAFM